MNITWNKVLWFAAGAIVGVAATSHFFKTKYERLYQEDVAAVKQAFSEALHPEPTEDDDESMDTSDPTPDEIMNYNSIIGAQGYGESVIPVDSARKEVKGVPRPRVISPVEFDTEDDYEVYTLTYYADGVLADEQGNPVENVEDMVGRDSLNHFGEYEDDSA